jgi:uncharacterized membrane protein
MAQPIEVRKSVTIGKPREEIFEALRQRPILVGLFEDLRSVEPRRFRWVKSLADGGSVGGEVELDDLVENERVSWHAPASNELPHEGALWLQDAPPGRGTEVHVRIAYEPRRGRVGKLLLKLMGEEPKQEVTRHLYRLRQMLEAGEVATTEGQPSGSNREAEAAPAVAASGGEREGAVSEAARSGTRSEP